MSDYRILLWQYWMTGRKGANGAGRNILVAVQSGGSLCWQLSYLFRSTAIQLLLIDQYGRAGAIGLDDGYMLTSCPPASWGAATSSCVACSQWWSNRASGVIGSASIRRTLQGSAARRRRSLIYFDRAGHQVLTPLYKLPRRDAVAPTDARGPVLNSLFQRSIDRWVNGPAFQR